jgi:hypothetical protein
MRRALACAALALLTSGARGDGVEFFEKKVRPVLVEHCYQCHSGQAKKKRGGLLLDSREGLRKGGDTGPAVVPGKPGESLLLRAVRHSDDMLKMPPKGKLPDAVVADLEAWVKMGAPDPRDAATVAGAETWPEMLRNRRSWWSLQPVQWPAAPEVRGQKSEVRDPIDAFLLAKLHQKGVEPAPAADRRTLIRRLSLVLTGLPPTVEEVAEFVKDAQPQAVERLVDRLLASPHFGERWARHWMDVVRFSETHGNEWNYEVHHAWRYRDYLIRAFNEDVPYDQLVREHIAGDLLRVQRWNEREHFNESVIGTAFYRFGEANHDDCIGLPQIGYDLLDNQIDTLTKAFQATTVACARCHDHKLDAISTKDYHALLGILRSSRQASHTIDSVNAEQRKLMERMQQVKEECREQLGRVWLREAPELSYYLQAALARVSGDGNAEELARGLDPKRLDRWVAALKIDKTLMEDPFAPLRSLIAGKPGPNVGPAWQKLAEQYQKEERERADFNSKQFVTWADPSAVRLPDWQIGGLGLTAARPCESGELVLAPEGEAPVKAILPRAIVTHVLSERFNGTFRSPVLPEGKKYISFLVLGRHSSAVRLVSNNCQLNYANYRALTSDDWKWVTFRMPDQREALRTYAELMTMLDNPKFPDQLSALGGDPDNYRLPFEKAVGPGRSYFGLRRVVLHDGPEPPRSTLTHFRPLFRTPRSRMQPGALVGEYARTMRGAIEAWYTRRPSDDDLLWLSALLRHGLLSNSKSVNPRLEGLINRYRSMEKMLEPPRVVPGIMDLGPGIDQPVFTRGDCTKPGETVSRRYLEVLSKPGERFATGESGRRELAERIASADNPLTARVMVNRVWHHLFGTGLVRTVDDFGRVGELPSHPELLDYLADRFVRDGWSVKRLIRSIVLTEAFQRTNQPSALSREVDPQNRLLQHYPARRMEAEAIRDSILASSGRLGRTLYGMSITPYREKENADRRLFSGPLDGHGRRSVYIKNTLMEAPRFLGVFDFPGGKVTQGRRDVTNVPAQALALLNDPFVLQQADVWAEHLVARRDSLAERIEYMFETAFGRAPAREEWTRFEQAVLQLGELHQVPSNGLLTSRALWKDLAHTMFNLKEFIYIP